MLSVSIGVQLRPGGSENATPAPNDQTATHTVRFAASAWINAWSIRLTQLQLVRRT